MMYRHLIWLIGFAVSLGTFWAGASVAFASDDSDGLRIILVRHAEKEQNESRDPGLSDTGHERAQRLAEAIVQLDLVAIYSTELQRALQTAAPVAEAAGKEVEVVPYGAGPLEVYIETLAKKVRRHADRAYETGQAVLVVGHSNTTPALAEALLGHPVTAIAEDEYDRVIHLILRPDGAALAEGSG